MTIEHTKKILNEIFWPDDCLTPDEKLAEIEREQACYDRHEANRFGDADALHAGYKGLQGDAYITWQLPVGRSMQCGELDKCDVVDRWLAWVFDWRAPPGSMANNCAVLYL